MANSLVSPGVQVTVIDESNYAPTAVGTVPFILMATAQDKTNSSGTIASGTTMENAGKVYNISDQRDLVSKFGLPIFPTDASGARKYGDELCEYGLYAAHHVLSTINSAYVMRADVDLTQLEASETRPYTTADGGTLWLDSSITSWGVFEWDAYNQKFVQKKPSFLYTADHITGQGTPKSSYGNIGDYTVIGYENDMNPLYYKAYNNQWYQVGSYTWQQHVPTIVASNVITPGVNGITVNNQIKINNITVTATSDTAIGLVNDINLASIPGVTAALVENKLSLFAYITNDGSMGSMSNGSVIDGKIAISNVGSGTILTKLGIAAASSYNCPELQFSKHSNIPAWKTINSEPRPSGSIWIKTTNFNYGANIATYRRNAVTDAWDLVPSLLYSNDIEANAGLDPTKGGLGIAKNSLYTQYDVLAAGTVNYQIYQRYATGTTVVKTTVADPTLTNNNSFVIGTSTPGSSTGPTPNLITFGSGWTINDVASSINSKSIPYLTCVVDASGYMTLTHTAGGVILLANNTGTPLTALGITDNIVNVRYGYLKFSNKTWGTHIVSNWIVPTEPAVVSQPVEPVSIPTDGTLWFYSGVLEADIMINDNNQWKGYRNVDQDFRGFDLTITDENGPIFSFTKPTVNSMGSALVYGDLWIDTSDFDNYPKIYRFESLEGTDQWVQIDTTDATTENGILFADARWDGDYNDIGAEPTGGSTDIFLDDVVPITQLLNSDWIDIDAPDPELYPQGCLLFNTRRSSNNVKQYVKEYYTLENFPQVSLPAVKSTWQSHSGKKYNNVPFFGRQAQRNVIVSALSSAVANSAELREEGRDFNLLLCPGYPEVLDTLKMLNDDRKNTGFIIGEVPMGLSTDQTIVENYLIDATGSGLNGEDGLTTNDSYTAIFYPGAASVNALDGVGSIVVPMSALLLRTMILSDQRSEVWFAPAGNQRGVVDALAIGYVDRANNNAFVRTGTPQGLRDVLYQNRVNPVTYFPQIGYINYGNHTRQADATALDRINVARLVAYLRNRLEIIVRPLVFEPNDKITRDKAKAICDQLMNDVAARRGVYDFLVVCDRTNNYDATIDRNELHIDIAIEPVKAVEFIYIPVKLKATGQIKAGNLTPSQALG